MVVSNSQNVFIMGARYANESLDSQQKLGNLGVMFKLIWKKPQLGCLVVHYVEVWVWRKLNGWMEYSISIVCFYFGRTELLLVFLIVVEAYVMEILSLHCLVYFSRPCPNGH